MLSDRYMYKLSEPWENHRSCCSFSSRITSTGVTNTPNECKLSFFFDSQIFLYPPLKLTPLLCVSLCVSVLVSESVKLTLLRGDFAQSKSGH